MKSFSPVYLSILISCHVLILIGEIIDSGLKVNISFFKKNTDKYLGLLDFITLTRSLFTCVRQKKKQINEKIKRKGEFFRELFSSEWKCCVYLLNIMMVAFLIKTISW